MKYEITCDYEFKNRKSDWKKESRVLFADFKNASEAEAYLRIREQNRYPFTRNFSCKAVAKG